MLSRIDGLEEMLDTADVVFLGTRAPMGSAREVGATLYQITVDTLEVHFRLHLMHSMPAGDEVAPSALYHKRSLVFDQSAAKFL